MIGFSILGFLLVGLIQIEASRRGDCSIAPSPSFHRFRVIQRSQLKRKIDDWDSSMSVQQVVAVRSRLFVSFHFFPFFNGRNV